MQRLERCGRAALVMLMLAGCSSGGESGSNPDARPSSDGSMPPIDAAIASDGAPPIDANLEPPPPPVLGVQLHRAGRPVIRTMLIGLLATPDVQASLNAAYDAASDPAAWKTLRLPNGVTLEQEIATNMAVWDAFDRGQTQAVTGAGCGNTFSYVGPVSARSYVLAADLFADDQLYVDTTKPTCDFYLDLETFKGSGQQQPATTCGGRTPTHDVVDVTYSVLASGTFGLSSRLPKFHDSVAAHADVSTTFPFLGAPH